MLEGFICPEHGEAPGRENNIKYCITECPNPCTAPNVLVTMLNAERANYHQGKRISVTMLTGGCKRRTLLERNLPYYVEPDRALPAFRGSLIHALVEEAGDMLKEFGWQIELHLELVVRTKSGEWILTGTLDAYDSLRKTLYDLKTLQEYAVKMMVLGKNKGTWSEHIPDYYVKQTNIYRYMAKKLELFTAEHLKLQILTFRQLLLTGKTHMVGLQKGFKWSTEEYTIPPVPILDDELVKEWIESEGEEWYRILFEGAHAPVVSKDQKWLCKICPFIGTKWCPNPDKEREEQEF